MNLQQIKIYTRYLVNRYSKYLVIVAAILLYFLWQQRKEYKIMAASWQEMAAFRDQEITKLKNTSDQVISQQRTIITENALQIKNLSAEMFNLGKKLEGKIKEVQALVSVQQEIRLPDTVHIPFTDTRHIRPDSMVMAREVVIPPKPFYIHNLYYTIAGKVLLKEVQVDSMYFPNKITFRIAEEKKNWWSSRRQVLHIVNSNIYMQTLGSQSMTLKPKVSAWHKWIKPALAAAVAGYISYKL